MATVEGANGLRLVRHESGIRSHAQAGGLPHIRYIKILPSPGRRIEPAGAHSGPDVEHACPLGNVGKGSIAIVAVEVLASEVVHRVEIGPAVVVEVAPGTSETVMVV